MTKQTTLKAFIENSHINATLIRAVVRQAGGWDSFKEIAENVCEHGAAGGFSGFTYYNDTVAFTKRQKANVMVLLNQLADDIGEPNVFKMVAGFSCVDCEPYDVAAAVYTGKGENVTQVYNALAWFALEEVSRSYVDFVENN